MSFFALLIEALFTSVLAGFGDGLMAFLSAIFGLG